MALSRCVPSRINFDMMKIFVKTKVPNVLKRLMELITLSSHKKA